MPAERQTKYQTCESGKANDIFDSIQEVLNHYDAWSSIKKIITDTTDVNTGQQNGVVKKIQDTICSKGFCRPKYIVCQHHILDTILRHLLNFYLHNRSTKPELEYDFIDQQYENLQNRYPGKEDIQRTDNPG